MTDPIEIYNEKGELDFSILRPVKDELFIVPDRVPPKVGGLYMPEKAQHVKNLGTIAAKADTVTDLELGDRIMFKVTGVRPLKYGETFLFKVPRTSILCTVTD